MDDTERLGYRTLFDATMKHIEKTEEFLRVLEAAPRNAIRDRMLETIHRELARLRDEADELEPLGWDSGTA
jgi:GTPase involved in cell partitioning and DNA repair